MNNRKINAFLAAASLYCGGFDLHNRESTDERFKFEKTTNKGLPGHYNKLKHMSAKKRKKYLAKKRKNNKGGSNTNA